MITIMFSGRRREGQSLESFYHEFESTHVDLMRQARCERFIKRYIQNKAIQGIDSEFLLAKMDKHYDSQASLTFDDSNAMNGFFMDPDYNQIVKPHEFIDPTYMTFELCEEQKIKTEKISEDAVKVIYYFKAHPKLTRSEFRDLIDGPYTELVIAPRESLLDSHLRFHCYPEESTDFMKSVFPQGKISQYQVIEELWFENQSKMQEFHQGLKQKLTAHLQIGIDFENSFSMLVSDKVVFGVRH